LLSCSVCRWGFLRDILNLLKFQCNSDQECEETRSVREAFLYKNYTYPFIDTYVEYYYDIIQDLVSSHGLDLAKASPAQYKSIFLEVPVRRADNNQSLDLLKDHLYLKLTGERNNFGLYADWGIDTNMSIDDFESQAIAEGKTYPDTSVLPPDNALEYVLLSHIVLTMPLPGKFGTFIANFQDMPSIPTCWYLGIDNNCFNEVPDLISSFKYFQAIFDGMVGITETNETLGINPFDMPAILSPVPRYAAHQKYPRQFTNTAGEQHKRWLKSHTQDQLEAWTNDVDQKAWPFFYEPNFLGKVLGPNLIQVMEVMFHCMLRSKPLIRRRFKQKTRLYGDLPNIMKYTIELENEPFAPTWDDMFTTKNRFPYQVTAYDEQNANELYFENSPDSYMRADYNGTKDADADNIIEELRLKYQYRQMIMLCKGPSQASRSCQNKFEPVITDKGICFSFNARNSFTAFKNNTYIDTFHYVYDPINESNIINNENSGQALKIILDSHITNIPGSLPGSFKIAINQESNFFNVRESYIDADVGSHTRLSVQISSTKATEKFKKLDLSVRECRFSNENPDTDSIFQYYSQKSCLFECRLRHSHKKCGCTPWNYPHYGNDSITEICDGPQSYCFEEAMGDDLTCQCLPDCEEVSFAVSSDKFLLDSRQECHSDSFTEGRPGISFSSGRFSKPRS
jgi:hypothetical protein